MKSFKLYKGKHEKFSIRKLSVGVVSLAIAALAIYGTSASAQADETEMSLQPVTQISGGGGN